MLGLGLTFSFSATSWTYIWVLICLDMVICQILYSSRFRWFYFFVFFYIAVDKNFESIMWHHRLGHIGKEIVNRLVKKDHFGPINRAVQKPLWAITLKKTIERINKRSLQTIKGWTKWMSSNWVKKITLWINHKLTLRTKWMSSHNWTIRG